MEGLVNGYYRFSVWTMRLAFLNVCWILFSALGLFVLGFMPATAAMFAIVRKWVRGEEDVPIFRSYWKAFKAEFVKANAAGLVLFVIGYMLILEFNILRGQDSFIYLVVSYTVLASLILYVAVFIYFFPILVHFRLKWVDYFKWPFIISFTHPVLTLFIMAVLWGVYYITWISIPALFFFFGGSVTALFIMWAVSKSFPKYEYHEA
ncbi:YesL family protein [Lentibacillus saliphilus]|uniref:YesL family protein n=1 Tax=Lentibacillus saliphilus TaxID=2737028 RepID=UPI001C2FCD3A|nr:YesL family protein [Lentibacillus saliphilus]